jgi:hypothetical protein
MKRLVFLLFTGISFTGFAQKKTAGSTDDISPAALSQQITASYTTEKQKVTAIFRWIIDNISYNIMSGNRKGKMFYEEPEDTDRVLKPLNERVAEMVLRKRVAVCDGYSRLFTTLCDYAGIRSEIITGYARTGRGGAKFRSNHKWNAVLIDSNWYLLDATWACGFINWGDEFIKEYDNRYFLTPPELFIQDHYPEDVNWTLLKITPALNEFRNSPFRYTAFLKSDITSYSPSRGIIEAAIGDSIDFKVETSGFNKAIFVTDTPPPDSSSYMDEDPVIITNERKLRYTYTVTDNAPEWLYVVCNGEVILRYKLNIKKTDNKTAMLSSPN